MTFYFPCFLFLVQVLPSLRAKHDEFMLRELVKRWANHKIMVRWLSRFFHYLDRYFIARRSLPPLNEVGLTCFRDLVMLQWILHDAMLIPFLISILVHDINKDKLRHITTNWVAFLLFSLRLMLIYCKIKLCFFFLQVYKELNGKVRDAIISLVCFSFFVC